MICTLKRSKILELYLEKDIVTLSKVEYESLFLSWYDIGAFNDSKKGFDNRLKAYQDKDFWKE